MNKKLDIPAPVSLSKEMVEFAKSFVRMRFVDGMSIGNTCKELSTSTATFYKWQEIDAFKNYMKDLESVLVTDDEAEAYKKVKAYILKKVSVDNPTDKHIEMFFSHFKYVVDAENTKRMSELGIKVGGKTTDFKTIEERKASILQKLRN